MLPSPLSHLSHLPAPDAAALAHSARLTEHIAAEIAKNGGWISFSRFMELALHAPGLGYYSAGARKFGRDGDFVTAPELGSVFACTLARQAAQVLQQIPGDILELGAGSGKLACDLLAELDQLGTLPQRYLIIETSGDLQARQRQHLQQKLPHLAARVVWLDTLPQNFEGVVIGNEVLDAMPVHVIRTRADGIDELGVALKNETDEKLSWQPKPASGALLAAAEALQLPPDYTTEIGLAAQAFVRSLGAAVTRGVVLLIDYGFPAREYYHPQRGEGTLMCHYRHRAHDDPFCIVGLQDITAHVDFTAIAHAAIDGELEVLGYANQARFLVNCGITQHLEKMPLESGKSELQGAAEAHKLLSPAEMGELFKVVAFGRGFKEPLIGFASGDRRHTL